METFLHLDKQHPTPIYLQLKQMLQNQIEQGVYRCHQRLPSERYLCEQYNLSRMTARRALQALIADGLAYTRAGKGTFVNQISNTCTTTHKNGHNGRLNGTSNCGSLEQYRQQLINSLLNFSSTAAESIIKEALALYPAETVLSELFLATIKQVTKQWEQGNIGLLPQTYTINTIRSEIISLINATPNLIRGRKILLACAPGDQHEIGLLSLALHLRRRGYLVTYLGTNITTAEFDQVIDLTKPQIVCFSAATQKSAELLMTLNKMCQPNLDGSHNVSFSFGGVAFYQNPDLIKTIDGVYLGDTLEIALTTIETL